MAPATPTGSISAITTAAGVPAPAAVIPSSPAASTHWPATIVVRGPTRAVSRGEQRLRAAVARAIGTNISPADSADWPRACWKKRPKTKTAP